MKTYKQIREKGYIFDASGIDNPYNWLWDNPGITNVYYPVKKLNQK